MKDRRSAAEAARLFVHRSLSHACIGLWRVCAREMMCAFNCLCLHLCVCCVSVGAAVISSSRVTAGVCVCVCVSVVKIATDDALDCRHINERTSLHAPHLPFFLPPNHSSLITRPLDQYLLCMAFSVLCQHLEPSEMIPPGTHPPGEGLFVQTAGDIGRVNLY